MWWNILSFSWLRRFGVCVRERKSLFTWLYIEVTAEPEQETPVHAAPQGSPPLADQPARRAGLFQEL
jgi:hypothetical protein